MEEQSPSLGLSSSYKERLGTHHMLLPHNPTPWPCMATAMATAMVITATDSTEPEHTVTRSAPHRGPAWLGLLSHLENEESVK